MIAYFVRAKEGADALGGYSALAAWWSANLSEKAVNLPIPDFRRANTLEPEPKAAVHLQCSIR
ncbi:hypothetical protein [Paracoccus sp. 4-2]|uniref:Uncharacterized protein n=1 Tax=Paracoccus alkanivorans TaxID=2116655 RepID=A0A3M0MK89_9RHOB|nr:hypothetical protein C9E81_04495 [Paracoccus alkanivorans]